MSNLIDLDHDDSIQMALAQIIWWGLGLTMIYDTAERVFHLPHLWAIAMYSSLMIISAWLRVRAMTVVGVLLLPVLLATIYFSWRGGISGQGYGAQWTQMLSTKGKEYMGWLLLVAGSFITGQFMLSRSSAAKKWLPYVGVLSLGLGAYMTINAAIIDMQLNGQSNMTFLIVQQSSYFIWLIGVSSKPPKTAQEVSRRRVIFVFPRLPMKPTVLLLGTAFFVGYDAIVLQMAVGWQCITMLLPPIAMVFRHKWIHYFSFYS